MNLAQPLSKHLLAVYFGGNWTAVNLKDSLSDVTWKEASADIAGFNTIASVTKHMTYYTAEIAGVLEGGPLTAKDNISWEPVTIANEDEWNLFLEQCWKDARHFANEITRLSEGFENRIFVDQKYGTYYANLGGIIEHLHYHIGQIVILKKLLRCNAPLHEQQGSLK